MKATTCALAILAAPGAALANCPSTYADAANGVFVAFGSDVVRYDRRPDGTVEELEFDTQEASGYRYLSHHGILILQSWEMIWGVSQPDTHEVITYDTPLPAQFTANSSYRSMTTVRYGTDAPVQEPVEVTVGAQGVEQIGGCAMQTLPIQMRSGPPNDLYFSNFTYFPALGFGVFVGGGPAGGTQDVFRATFIGTEPPSAAPAASPAPSPAPAPTPGVSK